MALDAARYETLADRALDDLADAIDAALGDTIDVERQGAILTLSLDDGGQYVINKHAPTKQIWLSSPRSGALHFDYEETAKRWRATKGGADLHELLGRELGINLDPG